MRVFGCKVLNPIAHGSAILIACGGILVCGCFRSTAPPTDSRKATTPRDILSLATVQHDGDGQVVALSFFGSDVSDEELQQLASCRTLRELSLQECDRVSDRGLSVLEHLSELRVLRLTRVSVSDEGLRNVRSESLEEVLLAHTNVAGSGFQYLARTPIIKLSVHSRTVTASGMSQLAQITTLRELDLHCPEIRIQDLPQLAVLTNLESLIAIRTPLGAAGLEKLRGMPRLRRLQLDASDLTDETISVLNTLPELEELDLSGAQITSEGLKQLSMPTLRSLSLCGCLNVTDSGLRNLNGLPRLQTLNLTDSAVTGMDFTGLSGISSLREVTLSGAQFQGDDRSINALKKLLPDCKIMVIRG